MLNLYVYNTNIKDVGRLTSSLLPRTSVLSLAQYSLQNAQFRYLTVLQFRSRINDSVKVSNLRCMVHFLNGKKNSLNTPLFRWLCFFVRDWTTKHNRLCINLWHFIFQLRILAFLKSFFQNSGTFFHIWMILLTTTFLVNKNKVNAPRH